MCNCGKKRTGFSQNAPSPDVNTAMRIPIQTTRYASFEYTGKSALTVIGNKTGMQYRFNYPGNRQNVDSRDISGIKAISVLKQV